MQNPRSNNAFEADYAICDGDVATMLDTITRWLLVDDDGNTRVQTQFGNQLLGLVKDARDLVSQRTHECEWAMAQY